MALDLSRYRAQTNKKITLTYTVPVDAETKARLKELKRQYDFEVSKWVRDLILAHLPEVEDELKQA